MRKLTAALVVTVSIGGCRSTETRNPPPLERALDARGVPLDLRPDEVARLDDDRCVYHPPVECPPPEEATCNPPAPIPVDCPGALRPTAEPPTTATTRATASAAGAPTASSGAFASIGVATMEDDGTIVLVLRAEGPNAVGDALLRYSKTDPKYDEILRHLGGLKPGESKPVPPFPE